MSLPLLTLLIWEPPVCAYAVKIDGMVAPLGKVGNIRADSEL